MNKNIKTIFVLSTLILTSLIGFSASIDTIAINSNSMKREIKACVIKPQGYKNSKKSYNTLYLLHGYSDNYTSWLQKVKEFPN